MGRYTGLVLLVALSLIAVAAAFNLAVDPYRFFGTADVDGFNRIKPAAGSRSSVAKPLMLSRTLAGTLILGNSRAEVGFSPGHYAWPTSNRPVFNAALPGQGPDAALRMLELALVNARAQGRQVPRTVLWGVDFVDFLPSDAPAGDGGPDHLARGTADLFQGALTRQALSDSLRTVLLQSSPSAADLDATGFNPMREYARIAAVEGYWRLFDKKDREYAVTLTRRVAIATRRANGPSPAFDTLRRGLKLCADNGIELILVIYPYHGHFLELFRLTGLWSDFEAWKRALAELGAESLVPIWDFALFNDVTTESVPSAGERSAPMHWYWESGHFKRELGDRVLDRIHGLPDSERELGLRLVPAMLEEHLDHQRTAAAHYRTAQGADIGRLIEIVAGARP
jgi:hypothetical protein